MDEILKGKSKIQDVFVKNYQSLNPDYWVVYYKSGLYFYRKKDYAAAKLNFEKALTKEVTTLPARKQVEKYLQKTNKKLRWSQI